MDNRTLLRTGVAGTIVAALCCTPPMLVLLLDALGLSAWVGGLDDALIPALVVLLGLTIYALKRQSVEAACCTVPGGHDTNPLGGRQ